MASLRGRLPRSNMHLTSALSRNCVVLGVIGRGGGEGDDGAEEISEEEDTWKARAR